jgi:type VI protein secretion system component Hcp
VATGIFLVLTNAQGNLVKGESPAQVNDPWIGSVGAGITVSNPIELASAHVAGASSTSLGSATGAAIGKLSMDPAELVMATNLVSPAFFLACASGTVFNFADVLLTKAGGTPTPTQQTFLSYRLSRAFTVGYDDSSSGDAPVTRIQLLFTQLQIGYRTQNPDGTLGTFVHSGWDFSRNMPI